MAYPSPHTLPAAPAESGRASTDRTRPARRSWWTAFAGFFLICAAWALAAPYDASPDEAQHILRAVGVARGEIAPKPEDAAGGTGAYQHVPASLVRDNCWQFKPEQSAACATPPGGDDRLVKVGTRAGRYNPVYYAAVGWPLALWPDWLGLTIARLVSAALTALLLASAAHAVIAWTRHRIMAAGLLAATTPITAHLSGSINPNGLEIAAGIALFAALVPTVLDFDTPLRRAAMVQIGVAGCVLATLRALGPLWVLSAFGILLFLSPKARLKVLAKDRGFRWAAGSITVAILAGAAWTVVMKASQLAPINGAPQVTVAQGLRHEIVNRWPGYITEMIGVPSWLDTNLPGTAYVLWELCLGVLLVLAVACGRWVDRWRLFALFAVAFGVPTISDAISAQQYGFAAQGRYMLPIAVGMPLLAAFQLGRHQVLDTARSTSVIRTFAVILLPLQLAFLAWTMIRWQSGLGGSPTRIPLNPLAGNWHPEVGSATVLVVAMAGCLALGAWAWAASRNPSNTAEAVRA